MGHAYGADEARLRSAIVRSGYSAEVRGGTVFAEIIETGSPRPVPTAVDIVSAEAPVRNPNAYQAATGYRYRAPPGQILHLPDFRASPRRPFERQTEEAKPSSAHRLRRGRGTSAEQRTRSSPLRRTRDYDGRCDRAARRQRGVRTRDDARGQRGEAAKLSKHVFQLDDHY